MFQTYVIFVFQISPQYIYINPDLYRWSRNQLWYISVTFIQDNTSLEIILLLHALSELSNHYQHKSMAAGPSNGSLRAPNIHDVVSVM